MNELGIYLRETRTARGLSLREVERISGVSNAYISQVENHDKEPSLAVLSRLAYAYGLTLQDLILVAGFTLGLQPQPPPGSARP